MSAKPPGQAAISKLYKFFIKRSSLKKLYRTLWLDTNALLVKSVWHIYKNAAGYTFFSASTISPQYMVW